MVEVERFEGLGDLLRALGDYIELLVLALIVGEVGADRRQLVREPFLLLCEEFGADLAVVVQAKELPTLLEEILDI